MDYFSGKGAIKKMKIRYGTLLFAFLKNVFVEYFLNWFASGGLIFRGFSTEKKFIMASIEQFDKLLNGEILSKAVGRLDKIMNTNQCFAIKICNVCVNRLNSVRISFAKLVSYFELSTTLLCKVCL